MTCVHIYLCWYRRCWRIRGWDVSCWGRWIFPQWSRSASPQQRTLYYWSLHYFSVRAAPQSSPGHASRKLRHESPKQVHYPLPSPPHKHTHLIPLTPYLLHFSAFAMKKPRLGFTNPSPYARRWNFIPPKANVQRFPSPCYSQTVALILGQTYDAACLWWTAAYLQPCLDPFDDWAMQAYATLGNFQIPSKYATKARPSTIKIC